MKTNQILVRRLGEYSVPQRTVDGFFNGNDLLQQWNKKIGNTKRRMDDFLGSVKTVEFIETIKKRESPMQILAHGDFHVVIKSKGRNTTSGRTPDRVWMHPYLFIDFAMWINPEFKYDVIKFVYDELIKYRNDAGDAYREMSEAIARIANKDEIPKSIQHVAKAINHIVFNQHRQEIRNTNGDENMIRELYELEKDIAKLIKGGFITKFDDLINYLRKLWLEKHMPMELSA